MLMDIPGFTAESSFRRGDESYRIAKRYTATRMKLIQQEGPLRDCACCIGSDSYGCCARCAEWILDHF